MEHMEEALTYDVGMFKETFEHSFTYLNGFMRNTHRFANRPALTDPLRNLTWTYAELNREANRFAHALLADGVGRGDVVMYQLLNSAEFVFSFLGPQKIGAINCPINFRLSPGETAFILDDSKPAAFVYDSEFRETALLALSMAEHRPARVIMVDFTGQNDAPEGHVRTRIMSVAAPRTTRSSRPSTSTRKTRGCTRPARRGSRRAYRSIT